MNTISVYYLRLNRNSSCPAINNAKPITCNKFTCNEPENSLYYDHQSNKEKKESKRDGA